MTAPEPGLHDTEADEVLLAEWAAELVGHVRDGEPIDPESLTRGHPERASALRRIMPVMERVAGLGTLAGGDGSRTRPASPPLVDPAAGLGRLGDFDLIREVGRGGMGVVYEAQQRSLGRRVALKVLPFSSAIDSRQLQRFHLEAQVAALLQHTHIVPVHASGCERGVHYYAMQYIDGPTLAEVVRDMRRADGLDTRPAAAADALSTQPDTGLRDGAGPGAELPGPPETGRDLTSTARGRGFFWNVARIGMHAAEALEHAHRNGVLHRDIKPANLMLDGRGHLWVTDFGLARFQNDPGMTASGDVLGTLRYMSPEQALARRAAVDHRTDVYSLGVTLYELLTLRPAFDGGDRAEILRRIAHEEPIAPRRLVPALPRDLETVILKAMAKEPEDRYPTAREFADDLGRVLEHRPVRARRPSVLERASKFARRHRATVSAVGVLLVLTTVLTSLAAVQYRRMASREHRLLDQESRSREELESRLYFHHINLAASRSETNDDRDVGPLLDACPARLRGWEWYYLKGKRRTPSVLFTKHGRTVHDVAYHPDGTRVASVDSDGGVKVWDPRDGHDYPAPGATPNGLFAVAYSPDGTKLAAAGADPVIYLWDSETGRTLKAFASRTYDVRGLAFSADGNRLVATGPAGEVRVWEAETGRAVFELSGHATTVQAVACGRDGGRVASSSEDGDVRLWDAATGRAILTFRGHNGPVRGLAFSPDSNRIATAGGDGLVKIWQASTGREEAALRGHHGLVTSVAFSPDGGRVVSSSEDGDVRLWDAATGSLLVALRGHAGPVQAVAFGPDGTTVVSTGDQGDVRVWDVGAADGDRVWAGHTAAVRCVAYSPDGRLIASAGANGEVRLWDAESGATRAAFRSHGDVVYGIAFNPDGLTFATGGKDGVVRVWDRATAAERASFIGHTSSVLGVAYSPDGSTLASAARDGQIILWDARHPRRLRDLGDGTGAYRGLAYSPDGRLIAAACWLHKVEVWDAATGRRTHELIGHTGSVTTVAFSPDGKGLASAGTDRTIKIWDLSTSREPMTLAGHTGFVDALAYNPDGSRIASASWDQTVSLWDTRTGLRALTLSGHSSRVRGVSFSPDGTRIASVGSDRSVRVWRARLAVPYLRDPAGP